MPLSLYCFQLLRIETFSKFDVPVMKGLLVRIGIDKSYGHWNAPVDLESGEFIYVPIPEEKPLTCGLERRYSELIPLLTEFSEKRSKNLDRDLGFPRNLRSQNMHLDPDFDYLTYGDVGTNRGFEITNMKDGDIIAFYGSLRPIKSNQNRLVYALMGLYVVNDVVWANNVPEHLWKENAHTRRECIKDIDIIVFAKPQMSGRLAQCIPIGEWRNRAYRVRNDLLDAWGGLSVKDGFIQRSAVPPSFLKPEKFYCWFMQQGISLIQRNNCA